MQQLALALTAVPTISGLNMCSTCVRCLLYVVCCMICCQCKCDDGMCGAGAQYVQHVFALLSGLCNDTVRAILHRNYGTVDGPYRQSVKLTVSQK
jgi:hypothetical protein